MRRYLGDENLIGQLIEKISEKVVGKVFNQPYTAGEIKFSYIEDFNKEGDSYEIVGNKEFISGKNGVITSSKDKERWTNDEINHLRGYYKSGMSIDDIAAKIGRKREAVIFRLARIGFINMHQAINLVRGRGRNKYNNRGRGNIQMQKRRWNQRQKRKKRR